VSRSSFYVSDSDALSSDLELILLAELDAEYTRHPFFGSRKMLKYLRDLGHVINRKRKQRLMRKLGLAGMAPGPNTSRPHPQHKVYAPEKSTW
jgi:putative transposase